MSLTFGAATSDTATKGTGCVGLTAQGTWSACGWVYITTLTSQRVFHRAAASGGGNLFFRLSGTTGDLQVNQTGAASINYITNDTPVSSLNTWYFVAVTCQIGTAAHIYRGTLTTSATESTYGTATAGTAPATADSGNLGVWLGNNNNLNVALQGRMASWQVYNRVLSLGEVKARQFDMYRHASGCQAHWHLGDNGTGTVVDLSGNANHLTTVSGATQSDNPPIRGPSRRGLRAAYAVASSARFRSYFTGH